MAENLKSLQEKVEKIADYYGKELQLRQLNEECCELAIACNKVIRKGDMANLTEEIADVQIMIGQIKYLYNLDEVVSVVMGNKVERQLNRIQEQEENNG